MHREMELIAGEESKWKQSGFSDGQFMTAKQKERVSKAFDLFLKNNFKREYFTKELYEHLHLHCGFIAHNSIDGFYGTYFEDPDDTVSFLEYLFVNNYSLKQEAYEDVARAFINSFKKHKEEVMVYLRNELLRAAEVKLKIAQEEYKQRKELADKAYRILP